MNSYKTINQLNQIDVRLELDKHIMQFGVNENTLVSVKDRSSAVLGR
jgi:hypothetical protein